MSRRRLYEMCRAYRESIGAPWFTAAWDINLIISRDDVVGTWGDRAFACTVDDAERIVVQTIRCTSDAWEGEWAAPSHPDGCVWVLNQHVPGGFTLGEHKGRPALRQARPFLNVRWPASSGVPTVEQLEARANAGFAFSDVRGTHFHNRVNGDAPARPRPNDSEGCTVSLYYHQHAALIALVERQRDVHGSTVVSPTYCGKRDLLAFRSSNA